VFTPRTLVILPNDWLSTYPGVDLVYGSVVLLLNVHSYMDFFFGFNGGFSTSIMVKLLGASSSGLDIDEISASYRLSDGADKLLAWRLPRLVETGYLSIDPVTRRCTLTGKGRFVARIGLLCKRLLGLGKGG
jgi:hypothetical protein